MNWNLSSDILSALFLTPNYMAQHRHVYWRPVHLIGSNRILLRVDPLKWETFIEILKAVNLKPFRWLSRTFYVIFFFSKMATL